MFDNEVMWCLGISSRKVFVYPEFTSRDLDIH